MAVFGGAFKVIGGKISTSAGLNLCGWESSCVTALLSVINITDILIPEPEGPNALNKSI